MCSSYYGVFFLFSYVNAIWELHVIACEKLTASEEIFALLNSESLILVGIVEIINFSIFAH